MTKSIEVRKRWNNEWSWPEGKERSFLHAQICTKNKEDLGCWQTGEDTPQQIFSMIHAHFHPRFSAMNQTIDVIYTILKVIWTIQDQLREKNECCKDSNSGGSRILWYRTILMILKWTIEWYITRVFVMITTILLLKMLITIHWSLSLNILHFSKLIILNFILTYHIISLNFKSFLYLYCIPLSLWYDNSVVKGWKKKCKKISPKKQTNLLHMSALPPTNCNLLRGYCTYSNWNGFCHEIEQKCMYSVILVYFPYFLINLLSVLVCTYGITFIRNYSLAKKKHMKWITYQIIFGTKKKKKYIYIYI